MKLEELSRIENHNGDYLEYEEYFRRVFLEVKKSKVSKEELKSKIFPMLDKERSSVVIESTIKLLHSLEIEIPIEKILPLVEIGDVLSTFSIYILEKKTEIDLSSENILRWKYLIKKMVKSENILQDIFMRVVSKISYNPEIRELVSELLLDLSVNSLRLCTVLLKEGYFSSENEEVSRVFSSSVSLLGDFNLFLSSSASSLLLSYREYFKIPETIFYERIRATKYGNINGFLIVKSVDNFIRDIFKLLPKKERSEIIEDVKNKKKIFSIFKLPKDSVISRKIENFIINFSEEEETRYEQTNKNEEVHDRVKYNERGIDLSNDYYSSKDLSNLFRSTSDHSSCVEY